MRSRQSWTQRRLSHALSVRLESVADQMTAGIGKSFLITCMRTVLFLSCASMLMVMQGAGTWRKRSVQARQVDPSTVCGEAQGNTCPER